MSTTRPFDVVVVGELNADLILSGDVTPVFGQVEKLISDATLTIGSSSAIFACGAARLGLRVMFIGKVGNDEFGRFMLRELNERGVDTTAVIVDPSIKTGLSIILTTTNDRAILTYPGSISALHYDEIDLDLLSCARHLHLGAFYLLDTLRPDVPRLFETAHTRGLTTSLDTNYDPSGRWDGGIRDVLRHVDVFMPNETELCAITRCNDMSGAMDALSGQVPLLVVKQGNKGATARRGNERLHVEPLQIQVIDTVGAGDSFDAGFIYGYLSGWEVDRALAMASICGALSTRAAGGTSGQATSEEATAYFADDRMIADRKPETD
jgi:sugar/nucleoside kinase (ribokinase family)